MKTPGENGSDKRKIAWLSFIPATYMNTTADSEILGPLANKYEVFLLCPYFRTKRRLKDLNIRITAIPVGNRKPFSVIALNIFLFLFLPVYLIIRKPDFVIVKPDGTIFGFISAIFLKRLLGDKGFKVILDIRSTPVGFSRSLRFDLTVSIAKREFNGISTITPSMRKEICQKFEMDQSFLGVWSVGASTTVFNSERLASRGETLRNRLGLFGKFIVLYHGSILPRKGVIETVEAFQLIASKYPDIVLFLLGEGPLVPYLKSLIQERKIQSNVIIHDAVDYSVVPEYIVMCNVGIVPLPNISIWRHQCPLKLLEYLAMKKVAIITDIPANREVVGNRECGVYISSINPGEIADAVIRVYKNKEKLSQWGASGREIIEESYNWEKAAEDLEKYLESL